MSFDAESKPANALSQWKFDHVGLRVTDFASAVDWYNQQLGLQVLSQNQIGTLTIGLLGFSGNHDFSIELLSDAAIQQRPYDIQASFITAGWHHVSFRSGDLDADITQLRLRGVHIVAEPRDNEKLGIRFALIADPWGNILEILQRFA